MKQLLNFIKSDRIAQIIVWSIWTFMMLMIFATILVYAKNMPIFEDWLAVAPLTGNEPNLFQWLWEQNAEHRNPFTRLLLLILLKITHGDFRVGMYFDTVLMGIVSGLIILGMRHLRSGKTKIVDGLIPLTLLHLDHWENFLFSWQISFILPMALIFIMLLLMIIKPDFDTPLSAGFAGVTLILLPLCGGAGLIFFIFFAGWLSYCSFKNWHQAKKNGQSQRSNMFLLCCIIVSLALLAVYFIGYERPGGYPLSPSWKITLKTAAQLIAMSVGTPVLNRWKLFFLVIFGLMLASVGLTIWTIWRYQDKERHRALGLLLFLSNLILVALIIAKSRAGSIPTYGLPNRYVLLLAPIPLSIFFVWELYTRSQARAMVQTGMLLLVLWLMPLNIESGGYWGTAYLKRFYSVEPEIIAGTPALVIAERHKSILIHWWDDKKLASNIKMLHDAQMTIYARMPDQAF